MKKKLCLILSLAILVLQILPIANVFAALPPYEPPEGEHLDPKDYYLNYASQGIQLLQRPRLSLSVNGGQNDRITSGGSLVFVAKVTNDERVQDPTEINFSYTIGEITHTSSVPVSTEKATFTLSYDEILAANPDTDYVMTASYTENDIEAKAQVKFGVLGDNPAIVFTEPGVENTVSIDDPLHFEIKTFPGSHSTALTVSWRCGSNLSAGYSCPTTSEETDLAFAAPGTYNVTVTVTDNNGYQGTSTVTIKVVKDPPYISAFTIPDEFEAGSTATVHVVASDKFGTINRIDWVCSDNNTTILDNRYTPNPPAASIRHEITTQLPDSEGATYYCTFRVTDDDSVDSALYNLTLRTRISSTESTEPVETVIPDEPNTGVSTSEGASAVIDTTLAALSSLALCGLFAVIAKRRYQ